MFEFGQPGWDIKTQGNIRYGYRSRNAEKACSRKWRARLHANTGDSIPSERLKAHSRDRTAYACRKTARPERTLGLRGLRRALTAARTFWPNLSWHWLLSDGRTERSPSIRGRKGYYHALGRPTRTPYTPVHPREPAPLLGSAEDQLVRSW